MPNQITAAGIQTATSEELIASLTASFQSIYGNDINLEADTPDGQMLRIFVQSVLDLEDLVTQVHNNFDPDLAFGTVLDQRVAINGIQRKAGTYSATNITVTTNAAVTLQGLDLYPTAPYTVSDAAGTQWYLKTTQSPAVGGAYVYEFRAANPGSVLTTPNTITVPVTIVIGVTSVNNPTVALNVGLNEETDAELKVRRQKSVSLVSQGFKSGLLAALENINGVTTAIVQENNTSDTNAYNMPPHSIWVIMGGTVADADVATAIYQKRNAGCGIYATNTGTTKSYTITGVDGVPFVVKWDQVTQQQFWIKMTLTSIDGVNPVNTAGIVAGLPGLIELAVGEKANVTTIATLVQTIDPNCLVTFATNQGVSSDGVTYVSLLSPSSPAAQLVSTSAKIVVV